MSAHCEKCGQARYLSSLVPNLELRIEKLEEVLHMFYNYTTPEDCPTPHKFALAIMPELQPKSGASGE